MTFDDLYFAQLEILKVLNLKSSLFLFLVLFSKNKFFKMDQFVSHQVSKAEIARLREDYNLVRYDLGTMLCVTCVSVNELDKFSL